ncbi:MAG: hypothetical protein LCH57_04280 [Proteobacteria bacterium]|nr:hypothetical protein [Pseudomonadota bacterium]MDK2746857.1 hypothetical protein [Brevundimonas sp.]
MTCHSSAERSSEPNGRDSIISA